MKLLLLFVLFLILFKFSLGTVILNGILDSEYNCAKNLVSKLGLSNYFPTSVICFENLSCSDGYIPCGLGIKCDTSKLIVTDISLKNIVAASILSSADLNCFTNITSLTLLSTRLEPTFLSTLSKITSLTLNDSITLSTINDTINPNIKELNIQTSVSFTSNLKLSYLSNINNIQITSTNFEKVNIYLDNDIIGNSKSFNKFQIISNNLPNLNNIAITSLTIVFGNLFNNNFENTSTYKNIENLNLQISRSSSIVIPSFKFPNELNNGIINTQLKQLLIDYNVLSVGSPFDFSNFQNMNKLSLINIGNEFKGSINGEFPFIKLPSKLQTFNFNGFITLGLLDLSQFSNFENVLFSSSNLIGNLPKLNANNISLVDFSNNSITGTIDNSWCFIGSGGLNVASNQLTGTLPTCFSCVYYRNTRFQSQFSLNNQLVLPALTSVCSTLIPSIKIENGKTVLYGTDLGFDNTFFTSSPQLNWVVDTPNTVFYVDGYVVPTNFTFTFSAVPLEIYQLSTVTSYPIIKSYEITGSTDKANVTFKGEFFSYNSADITILFGSSDYGLCAITKSSFTKIECSIDNYTALLSTLSGSVDGTFITTIVTVNGRKSTQIMVDLNIGTGEKPGNMCGNESCSYFAIDGNEGVIGDHGICSKNGTCKCSFKLLPSGPNWTNKNCEQPHHYITSIIPTNQFGGIMKINGWFSNLHVGLKISINNNTIICEPVLVSSSQIQCRIETGTLGFASIVLFQNQISVYNSFYFNATCPNQCSGLNNGVCNTTTGECKCNSTYQSLDCSIPYKECPMNCSIHTLIDNGNSCNNQTGSCTCFDNKYTVTSGCLIPNHYCSSSNKVSSSTGGTVELFGWYGDMHEGLTVLIGNVNCTIINSTSTFIYCTIPPGTGVKSINITQNNVPWFGKDKFQYYNEIKSCAICLNGGTCNTGSGNCICIDKYTGYDCSGLPTTTNSTNSNSTIPPSENTIDKTVGTVSINNEQTKYNLLIKSLIEVDLNGLPLYSYDLVNKWVLNQIVDNENSTSYIFHQSINNVNNQINNTLLISTIQEIKKSKTIEFATVELQLEVNSIKVSIEINNYVYSSNLNTLQLLFESSVKDTNGNGTNIGNNCNNENTLVTETNLNDIGLNYLKIEKNGKIMMGRFVNYALSDGRPTFITTNIVQTNSTDKDSITISLNLPHSSSIIIDPDFSVLVSQNYISNCDSSNSRPRWFLPVVIVVPVVGCAALSIVAYTILKKNSVSLKIKMSRFKSRN